MKKIFSGSDVVLEAIVLKSGAITQSKDIHEIRDWRRRTFFLVNGKIYWYTDDAQWRILNIVDISDIKLVEMGDIEEKQFPFGLCVATKDSLFVKNFFCGFKLNETRLAWITAIKCLMSNNNILKQFINPGIGIIHICLLYKGLFMADHCKWAEILQNAPHYVKEFRKLDAMSVSPLHIASYFDFAQETNMILQNAGYMNTQTDIGKFTPLHLCLMNQTINNQCLSFEILIRHDSRTDIANEAGETVAQIVQRDFVGSKFEAIVHNRCYIDLDATKWTV